MLLAAIVGGLAWTMLPAPVDRPDTRGMATASVPAPVAPPVKPPVTLPGTLAGKRASFTLCHSGGGANCVVDGDTFRMGGVKIRIADIDTPETHPARCAEEAALGKAATRRLHMLLNSGAVSLSAVDRDSDRYGRKLRLVSVNGRGVGDILVAEGLARYYEGGRRSWC